MFDKSERLLLVREQMKIYLLLNTHTLHRSEFASRQASKHRRFTLSFSCSTTVSSIVVQVVVYLEHTTTTTTTLQLHEHQHQQQQTECYQGLSVFQCKANNKQQQHQQHLTLLRNDVRCCHSRKKHGTAFNALLFGCNVHF